MTKGRDEWKALTTAINEHAKRFIDRTHTTFFLTYTSLVDHIDACVRVNGTGPCTIIFDKDEITILYVVEVVKGV